MLKFQLSFILSIWIGDLYSKPLDKINSFSVIVHYKENHGLYKANQLARRWASLGARAYPDLKIQK